MFSLNMTAILVAVAVAIIAGMVVAGLWLLRRFRRRALVRKFRRQWLTVQRACAKSETWPTAVVDADKLVDDVLKATGHKGRTMGERLVSAQRSLSDNDSLWFAHKLCGRIANDEMSRLYKKDVQVALRGYRQALQDLGAIE